MCVQLSFKRPDLAVFFVILWSMDKRDRIERYAKDRPTFEWPSDVKSKKEYRDRIARPLAKLIVSSGRADNLFWVGNALMQVRDTQDGPRAFYLTHEERTQVIRKSVYVHADHVDDYKTIYVSGKVRGGVIRELVRRLPELNGISPHPIVTPSGDIVVEDGYNDETGIYVTGCSSMFEHLDYDERGEMFTTDVNLAKRWLHLLCGHRTFRSKADESRYVASILTAVMRSCFGAAPLIYSKNYFDGAQSPIAKEIIGLLQGFVSYPSYAFNANGVMSDFSKQRQQGDTVISIDTSRDPRIEDSLREFLTYTYHRHHKDQWIKIDGTRNVCTVVSSSKRVSVNNLRGLVLPVLQGWSDVDDPYLTSAWWVKQSHHSGTGSILFEPVRYTSRTGRVSDYSFDLYRSDVFVVALTLIRSWQRFGQPAPTTPSAFDPALDEWYYYVAGVLEHAGYTSISNDIAI